MGWFDEQIEYRKKQERELLSDSFENMARAVTGRKAKSSLEGADVSDAVSALMKYMGVKEKDVPGNVTGLEDRLEYLLSSTGIMYRRVELKKGWHRDAMGAMIGKTKSGTVIAILPGENGGYQYTDPASGKTTRVTGNGEKNIETDAYCFYRPLPGKTLKIRDLILYMRACLTTWDWVSFLAASIAIVGVGMLTPILNRILMGDVIRTGSRQLLAAVVSFLLFATVGGMMLTIIKSLLLGRIRFKLSVNVNAATMARILNLPATFFRQYSAGELGQYIQYMDNLCTTIVDAIFSTAVTGLFSLVYLTQIFAFAPNLVWPSILITILTLAVSVISAMVQMRVDREKMTVTAKERGLVYSLIGGIQKIRLSGAENRAFVKWSEMYNRGAALTYSPPWIIRISGAVTMGIGLIGTGIMYGIATRSGVSVADYYAFSSAYGYINSAFAALTGMALSAASIKPVMDILRPLLNAVPEAQENRQVVTRLNGAIEMSHVTFAYEEGEKPLFDDFNLKIRPREYVAIVGKSGSGKSTLVRLLLGFEKPKRGMIEYDGHDMERMDARSLRRHIGTVTQDGRLFSGSIYENITISAPMMKAEDVWEAAETAGIADDIRDMPMGMHTMIAEGGGTLSGGQRQRLMIARAIAAKPKILIFDEATSALDNITQKKVAESLDKMKCTRIVIAHRLSTIRNCDRILVLDEGKIVEDGTYEELIAKNGVFAELVERQRLDTVVSGKEYLY